MNSRGESILGHESSRRVGGPMWIYSWVRPSTGEKGRAAKIDLRSMYPAEMAAIKAQFSASSVDYIGEGTFGITFRVEANDVTALKLFKNPYDLARTDREIANLRYVKSRNIVGFVDEGTINIGGSQHRYFRCEFIDGETLERRLALRGKLMKAELLDLATQVAQGMDALHLRTIVHRDLKPANIMIEQSGRVVLIDLGLAKSRGAARVTASGTFVGTALYAAPEQLVSAVHVDIRADIFGLGIILYEAATGANAHPFDCQANMTLQEIYNSLVTKEARDHPLASFRGPVAKMLQAKPYSRTKTPRAVLNALNGI